MDKKYLLMIFVGLLFLVVALPVYALHEPERMAAAQQSLRETFVADGAVMYVDNCSLCHGVDGSGIGAYPALDAEAIRNAEYDFLYKTIARGRYNTAMAAWHEEDNGPFNSYQVQEMVAFLRYVDWGQVAELAAQQGVIPPAMPVPDVPEALLAQVAALGPDGNVWASGMVTYAKNCTTCHGVNGEGTDLAPPLATDAIRATQAGELRRVISEGVPGTMMPSWNAKLDESAIDELVLFISNWDKIAEAGIELTHPAPIHIDPRNPQEMWALGKSLYANACAACHGTEGEGGSGPALNSLQILSRHDDATLAQTIIYGPRRPSSIMPPFGDRLTSVEVDALVRFVRSWEATATWVENPRGTEQGGGGPPWLRATPDPKNPIQPGEGGGPPAGMGPEADWQRPTGPTLHFSGQVIDVMENQLIFSDRQGTKHKAMLGPSWWWAENGIELQVGDAIELEGFEGVDQMEVVWIRNLRTNARIDLRTPSGMPVWTG
jgi:mono/diheme cytochrome c family protein